MPYMYILECADGSYYTGSTWDLHRRLAEHQAGVGANHTATRRPVTLVYCERYDRVEDAFRREKQVQGWSRKKKQALMAGDSDQLHRLAVCQNESRASEGKGGGAFGPGAFDGGAFDSAQAPTSWPGSAPQAPTSWRGPAPQAAAPEPGSAPETSPGR